MPCGLSLTALRPAELTSTSSFPRWLIRGKKKKRKEEEEKRKREREKKNHEYASRRPGHDRLPAFRTRLRGPRIVEVILYGEPRTRPLDAVVPRACSCCNSPAARHRLIGPRYARIATAVASLSISSSSSSFYSLASFLFRLENNDPSYTHLVSFPLIFPLIDRRNSTFLFRLINHINKKKRRNSFLFRSQGGIRGGGFRRGRRQQVRGSSSSPRGRKETRNKYVAWQGGRVERTRKRHAVVGLSG